MLQTGIKGKKEITVTLDKTAKAMGSGTMDVFATDRKSTRLNSSHTRPSRMPSSA